MQITEYHYDLHVTIKYIYTHTDMKSKIIHSNNNAVMTAGMHNRCRAVANSAPENVGGGGGARHKVGSGKILNLNSGRKDAIQRNLLVEPIYFATILKMSSSMSGLLHPDIILSFNLISEFLELL